MKKHNIIRKIIIVLGSINLSIGYANASSFLAPSTNNGSMSGSSDPTGPSNDSSVTMVPPIQPSLNPSISVNGMSSASNLLGNNSDKRSISQIGSQITPSQQSIPIKRARTDQIDLFQRNIYIRTGLNLPHYGADLFNLPDSFAPMQNIPVPSGYTLGPGDRVQINTWGAVSGDVDVEVEPDGSIFIPKVGKVPLTGVSAGELDNYLKRKIGKSYRNFSLSANVSKVRSIQVTVAGFAAQPGTYQLSSLSTLTNAIFAVGGPSAIGSLRKVQLKRNGKIIANFDMYDVLLKGDSSKDVHLLAGDTIYFPPVGNQVAIFNGVKQPAIYEVVAKDRLNDMVAYAGGYSFNSSHDQVVLETMNPNKELSVNSYPTTTANNFLLTDGEIIHFFTATNKYINSVAVIGNVANPTRREYKQGMRVSDMIPNRESLLTSSYWNNYAFDSYGRDNQLTVLEVEKTNNQSDSSNTVNLNSGINSINAKKNTPDIFAKGQNNFAAGPIVIPEADINWNYAVIIRVDPRDYTTHLISFNLQKALAGDPINDLKLQPGDIINVLSAKDVRNPINQQPYYVFIDGEVVTPGVYEIKPGTTLTDLINRAGGLSDQAYLFGLELDRETVKQRQKAALSQMLDQLQQTIYSQTSSTIANATQGTQIQAQQYAMQQQQEFIDKMRKIEPSGRIVLNLNSAQVTLQDLPQIALENGDTVYIPPKPGVVDVVGQVFNPASFAYNKNYTVGKYIDMAGTETQFADSSYEYILRADGTLYSKQQAGWFGAFDSQKLNPGDVIIIPQQIQYGAAMQNLLNWTQILANFGTSAAAIAVFRN